MRLTYVRGAQCPHPHTQILEGRPRRTLVWCFLACFGTGFGQGLGVQTCSKGGRRVVPLRVHLNHYSCRAFEFSRSWMREEIS